MRGKICYAVGLFVVLCGLSACGDWNPEVSSSVATGSAVVTGGSVNDTGEKVKSVKEPTLEEVEDAYHFAIRQEVYLFDAYTRDGFTSKKLKLYRKRKKDGITYFLLDCTDKKEHTYTVDQLTFNFDCEEPGFESYVEQFDCTSEEKEKILKGTEKIGTLNAWESPLEKPVYKKPTAVTNKLVSRLEEKIKEDVKDNLVCSEAVTYHAYIQYFTAADKTAYVYLTKAGDKRAYELCYTLGDRIELTVEEDEGEDAELIWQGLYMIEDGEFISRFSESAMAVSDLYVPAANISDLGLSEEEIEQLQTICTNRNTWISGVDTDSEVPFIEKQFMISDLNQDGRMEVVTTCSSGSGGFMTRTTVFEVSGDRKSLVEYRNDEESPMEIGGSGVCETECYVDKNKKIYYYASENYTNVDGYKWAYAPGRFYLKDHAYKEDYMKADRTERKVDSKMTYYQGEKKISKAEYDKLWALFWQGMERKKAVFYWCYADDLPNMTDADALLALAKSWKGFAVNDSENRRAY